MKTVHIIILTSLSILGYSQSWEIPNWDIIGEEFTGVYDIANHGDMLYITGVKSGETFFFAFSDDGGNSWTEVILNEYITVELGIPITVGFFNPKQGVIGIKGSYTKQYLKTVDGGLTWEDYNLVLVNDCNNIPQPWQVTVVNDTTAIVQQFQSGDYIITHDMGDSWECNSDFTISWLPKFSAINTLTYFTFDNDGLYRSIDGGATWTTVLDIRDLSTFSMIDEENGFALSAYYASTDSDPRLYKTNDGWRTFETIPVPILNGTLIDVMVPINEEELFFLGYESIFYSNDGGNSVSFYQKPDFNQPTNTKKINNEWYAVGRDIAIYNPEGVITNTSELDRLNDLNIYPNPIVDSKIYLNSDSNHSYEIYTMQGTLVAEGSVNKGEILLNSTFSGLHILAVKDSKGFPQAAFKIVIE